MLARDDDPGRVVVSVSLNMYTECLFSVGYGENYSARVSLKRVAPTALGIEGHLFPSPAESVSRPEFAAFFSTRGHRASDSLPNHLSARKVGLVAADR